MNDLLTVPQFSRLDDWLGPWAYEPNAFLTLWQVIRGTNLAQHMAASPQPRSAPTMRMEPGRGDRRIAVIGLHGTLMKSASSFGGTSTVQVRRDIRQAANDPSVSGILLDISSPGGTVSGTEDLGNDIRAARRKKPVIAQISDMGASAAYWAASQATKVYASGKTTRVGSIGTLQYAYDMSRAAEQQGVEALLFSTGPLKGMGLPGTVITDAQRSEFQKEVDDIQVHFDDAVRSGRGLTAAQLAAVRTGGVWLAEDAKEKRLIDGVQSSEKTLAELAGLS